MKLLNDALIYGKAGSKSIVKGKEVTKKHGQLIPSYKKFFWIKQREK